MGRSSVRWAAVLEVSDVYLNRWQAFDGLELLEALRPFQQFAFHNGPPTAPDLARSPSGPSCQLLCSGRTFTLKKRASIFSMSIAFDE
jgi:hypothetical protein